MPQTSRPAPQHGEPSQADLLAFLASRDGLAAAGPCRRIDTHAASIFLAGDRAWKLKRAVRYPYLDFTDVEQRRSALEAELRLNRRTAPDLYVGVHPITREGETFAIAGAGPAVDWILEMRRFPDGALLDELACRGPLDGRLVLRLAERIHAFHEAAEPAVIPDAQRRFRAVIDGNAESLRPFAAVLGKARIVSLLAAQGRACSRPGRARAAGFRLASAGDA